MKAINNHKSRDRRSRLSVDFGVCMGRNCCTAWHAHDVRL